MALPTAPVLSVVYANQLHAMSTDLSIRPVSRLDYDQWLSLWQGYNAFYGRSGPTALPAEITQITWARFFDAYEPVYALVAETSGQLVGLAHYLFHRSTTNHPSLLPARSIHCRNRQWKRSRQSPDPRSLPTSQKRRLNSHLLAHPRNQQDRPPPLRPSRRKLRLHRLPQPRMDPNERTADARRFTQIKVHLVS